MEMGCRCGDRLIGFWGMWYGCDAQKGFLWMVGLSGREGLWRRGGGCGLGGNVGWGALGTGVLEREVTFLGGW